MSKQDPRPEKSNHDAAALLAAEHKKRIEQRTTNNLQLVSAALTNPRASMRERRQRAEQMAREAMQRLRERS